MKNSDYHFITNWQVDATPTEVYEIISNSKNLTNWWGSVYLDLKVLEEGGEGGLSKLVELYTKGWLPYTLRWQFRVIRIAKPQRLKFKLLAILLDVVFGNLSNPRTVNATSLTIGRLKPRSPF